MTPKEINNIFTQLYSLKQKHGKEIAYLPEYSEYYFIEKSEHLYSLTTIDENGDFEINTKFDLADIEDIFSTINMPLMPFSAVLSQNETMPKVKLTTGGSANNVSVNSQTGENNVSERSDKGVDNAPIMMREGAYQRLVKQMREAPVNEILTIGKGKHEVPSLMYLLEHDEDLNEIIYPQKVVDRILKVDKMLDKKLKNKNLQETARKRYNEAKEILIKNDVEIFSQTFDLIEKIKKDTKQSESNKKTYNEKQQKADRQIRKNIKVALSTAVIIAFVGYFLFAKIDLKIKNQKQTTTQNTNKQITYSRAEESITPKSKSKKQKSKKQELITEAEIDRLITIYAKKYYGKPLYEFSRKRIKKLIGGKRKNVHVKIINYIKKISK